MTASHELVDVTLFPLIDADRYNLGQTDEQFEPHTWDELKEIIAENNLSILKRWPSDLKRYVEWSNDTKAQYGSVPTYIMKERLTWSPLSTSPDTGPMFECRSPVPFQDIHDYKILPNDWPYGLAPGITHIIVWLKHRLEFERTRGDITPNSRHQVENFVHKMFVERVKDLPGPIEKVMWFRNWTALQSVPGMEHVHVLVRNVPEDVILEWTKGETIKQG